MTPRTISLALWAYWLWSAAALAADVRYSAVLLDGTRVQADEVRDWHDTAAQPKLEDRALLDPKNPLSWLKDNTLSPAATPVAYVEMVGGDRLPGKVVGHRAGDELVYQRQPAHLLVEPDVSVEWPDPRQRRPVAVLDRWLRRIVWQSRGGDRYQPGTLFHRDGRQLAFRSLRWQADSVRMLLSDGTSEVPFSQIAELHLPRVDFWEAYYEQVALLSPECASRLIHLETDDGLRATASTERFQARNNGSHPDHWYHAVQPAWSLSPLWLRHRTIRLRHYFEPHEVPLSLVEPSGSEQKSSLSAAWHWQANRNVQGGPLRSGGRDFGWGLGVHAHCALSFDLTPLARTFRAQAGIDEAAGHGGCARVLVYTDDSDGKPLFKSEILVGSTELTEIGPLPLSGDPSTGSAKGAGKLARLTLLADPVYRDRPRGADPLDIRDLVDWLEPQIELDADALRRETLLRAPRLVPAFQGWTLAERDSGPVLLVNSWDDSDSRALRYQTSIVPRQRLLMLSRTVEVTPQHKALLLAVARYAKQTSAARLTVEIDGELLGQFEVPERRGSADPDPLWVPLDKYLGRAVTIQVAQPPLGPQALVEWRGLTFADRWPGLLKLFEDEPAVAEQLDPQSQSVQLNADDAYAGAASLKVLPALGSDPHRLELQLPIREHPKLGEYRFVRFVWKKPGGGRICCSFGHDGLWGPDGEVRGRGVRRSYRYDAGAGDASYGAALRIDRNTPQDWVAVTRDLYADFGEFSLTGLSLSVPDEDGGAAAFDQIYLGRTQQDFAKIDVPSRKK